MACHCAQGASLRVRSACGGGGPWTARVSRVSGRSSYRNHNNNNNNYAKNNNATVIVTTASTPPVPRHLAPCRDLCAREAVDAQLFACTVRLRSLGSAASSSSSTRRRNQSKRALHDWSGQNLERCYASETFWRFADCDAVLETRKSDFFGNPRRDVGLYEFFKAQLHTPAYKPLMMHTHASTLSEIDISETEYRRRFVVTRGQENSEDEAVYEIHMRLRPNGIWYTERLLRDDGDT